MTYKDRIPGMKPDARNRNIAVGVGYVAVLLLLFANLATVIGLLLLISPFIIAAIIGKNYKGSAGEMSRLPGISDEGGLRAGASAFVYSLVFVGVLIGGLTALAPTDNTAEEGTEVPEGESEAEATEADERSTVTVMVVDNDGEGIENAVVEFVHDDAIIFDTRESKETDADGVVSFETETDSNVDITAEASGYEEADASLMVTEDEEVTLTLEEVPEEAEEAEEDTEPADTDEDGMYTVTVYVTDADGEAVESANVEFVHDDAIIFNTRENKETDSEGMVSFETEADSNVDITAEASGYEEADASLTVSQDEEVTLTLQETPEEAEEAEEDTEPTADEADDESAEDEGAEQETDPTSDEAEDEVDEEEEQAAQQAAGPVALEQTLQENDVNVVSTEEQSDILYVEYESIQTEEAALAEEIAKITGAYVGITEGGYESERMEVSLYHGISGEHVADYHVESEWAEQYQEGDISEEELLERVFDTMEVYD